MCRIGVRFRALQARNSLRSSTCTLVAALALFVSASSVAQAQPVRSFTEWTVPTAGSEPLFARPITDDTIFFTERLAGKIGRLNPQTNAMTEWSVGGFPHDLTFGYGGVFFANQAGFIGKLMPGTSQLTVWPVPTSAQIPFSVPMHLELLGNIVYFTDNAGRIGRLNLATGALRLWTIPLGTDPAGEFPNGIDVDRSGRFVAFLGATKVGILDTTTNTFRQWAQPANPDANGHLQFFGRYLFFGSNGPTLPTSFFNRLDPVTNRIRSWALPAPSGIGDVAVEDDAENRPVIVDLTEAIGKVATFDTATPGVDATVTPAVNVVAPTNSTVTPVTFGVSKADTTVVPVRTTVTGVRTGGFVEWTVPTFDSVPGGLSRFDDDGLLFAERNGNKIALLSER